MKARANLNDMRMSHLKRRARVLKSVEKILALQDREVARIEKALSTVADRVSNKIGGKTIRRSRRSRNG